MPNYPQATEYPLIDRIINDPPRTPANLRAAARHYARLFDTGHAVVVEASYSGTRLCAFPVYRDEEYVTDYIETGLPEDAWDAWWPAYRLAR